MVTANTVENINKGHIKFGPALVRLGKENSIELCALSVEDVEVIHDEVVAKYGGSYGVRDAGLLQSVCSAPYQSVFGADLYPTVFDKAAKILFDFANYQIFLDGNKRTGLVAAHTFLEENGFSLDLTATEAYNLTMDIAVGKIPEWQAVSEYIEEHSVMKSTAPLLAHDHDEPER